MGIAELLTHDQLTPSQMRRLKNRVHYFKSREDAQAFLDAENTRQNERNLFTDVTVWTGIHSSTDWSRVYYWEKGWHFVNKTNDYAVVTSEAK